MTHQAPVLMIVSPSVSSEVPTKRMVSGLVPFARPMLAVSARAEGILHGVHSLRFKHLLTIC